MSKLGEKVITVATEAFKLAATLPAIIGAGDIPTNYTAAGNLLVVAENKAYKLKNKLKK